MERRQFEMSQADLDGIMDKLQNARSTPLLATNCGMPPSIQEVANAAWAELGARMGFDHMTVEPSGKGNRFFSALSSEVQPVGSERSDEGNLPPDEPILPLPHPDTSRHVDGAEEALRWFIKVLVSCGGQADAGDYGWNPLNAFCGDFEPLDTFNLAIERGFTTTMHDSDTDESRVRLTQKGRDWLAALAQPDPLTETSRRVEGGDRG